MRVKILACFLALMMVVGVLPAASAATAAEQVVYSGGSVLYNAAGEIVSGSNLGDSGSVVKISKTIEQYAENGAAVENEFVVTLQVQTSQDLKQIASDTPDSAVLLIMDVSNSMDDCVLCGQEEDHSNHKGSSYTYYYCSDSQDTTYTRGRQGNRCVHCGNLRSQHIEKTVSENSTCGYEARLAATKVAAKDFLDQFATETGAQDGDKRMVAIVAYGSHAVTELDWVDITTTEGMHEAETAIDGLTIANGNEDTSLQGGGTNIEGGLALGRNLLGQSAVSDIGYRYTILLTDGQPTYPASNPGSTSVESISGNTRANSGSTTQEEDIDNVAAIADDIREKSKLYSVCFGKVNGSNVWDLTPFDSWSGTDPAWSTTTSTTVGAWLGSFSTAAYKAADASSAKLFDTFSNILAQIQVAAKAWKVEDWMGQYMVYQDEVRVSTGSGYVKNNVSTTPNSADYPNGAPAFVWDLLTSENDPALTNWNESTNTGVLGYTYKYRVTLDNLDTGYSTTDGNEENPQNPATNANTLATLRYATTDANGKWPESTDQYKTATFPVPQVQGLVGSFSFEKVDQNGDPLEGWTFRLRAADYALDSVQANDWDYVEAVSNANGVVTFAGIPSGHSYTLFEAEKPEDADHYLDAGDFDVLISWGEASISQNGKALDDRDNDGYADLVNEYNDEMLGKLTLRKSFADGSEVPTSILFTITGPNNFKVERRLHASDEKDGVWTWTMTGLQFGQYTVQEIGAVDAHGNELRNTHDLSYTIYVNGAQTKTDTFEEGKESTYPKVTVDVTKDGDRTVVVEFNNNMTGKRGTLAVEKSFVDLPADLVNANMGLTMKVTATPVDDRNQPIQGADKTELTLSWENGRYYASEQLPIGRYQLTEEISGTVEGYSFLHYVFEQNGENIENGIVEITDGTTLSVKLKNHYEQDKAHIHIAKAFSGDLSETDFGGRVLYVKVYKADASGNKVGDPVATIKLDEGDGSWTGATPELPLGKYFLEEVTAEGEEGTAFTDGYAHEVTWENGPVVNLANKNQHVNVTLTNVYDQDTGCIKVTKSFAGDLGAEYFIDNNLSITIGIFHADDTERTTPVDTLTLPRTDDSNQSVWNDTSVELAPGKYVLVESGHEVSDYTVSESWTGGNTDNEFVVTKDVTLDVGLTNTYTREEGELMVTKTFDGLPASLQGGLTVTIRITGENDFEETLTLPVTDASGNKVWADSIGLPVGEYKLEETVTDAEGYTLDKAEWTGLAADGTVTVTKEARASVSVKNVYTDNYGYLTIAKKVSGTAPAEKTFLFTIVSAEEGKSFRKDVTVTVGSDGTGKTAETVKLPVGKYKISEIVNNESQTLRCETAFKLGNTELATDANGYAFFEVTSGEQLEIVCRNDYVSMLTVKIPMQKTVTMEGNTAPGKTTFFFGAAWSNTQNLPISVRYEDAEGNTAGRVESSAANTYTITVDGEGTVKGYIVVNGFADDLDGLVLTTWERLNPYNSAEEALADCWIYDETALNSNLRWKVTLKKLSDTAVGYDIALGDEDGKDAVAFDNRYNKVETPVPPETGDHDQPLLYLFLIALTAGGMLLLRRKHAR